MTDYGLIVNADILQAYGHDSTCRDDLLEVVEPGTTVIGDSAFLDLQWQQACYEKDRIAVLALTPIKSNMKKLMSVNPLSCQRSVIKYEDSSKTLAPN